MVRALLIAAVLAGSAADAAAAAIYLYVQDQTVLEPAEGEIEYAAKLVLPQPADTDLVATVTFSDAAKSGNESPALAGADYRRNQQTVTLAKGQTTADIVFTLYTDDVEESAETFRISASLPVSHYSVPGWITILDDDARLRFTSDRTTVFAGDDFDLELTLPYLAPAGSSTPVTLTISPLYIASVPAGPN